MKRLSAITMLLLLLSCNNEPEEPQVMTRQGALEAELQHAEKVREYLIQGTDLQQVPLTDDQIFDLKTEYAYWTTMSVFFLQSKSLAMAEFGGRERDSGKFERFFFDPKGSLVLAEEGDKEQTRRFYFVIDRLVLAVENEKDTLDNTSSSVKLSSINLVKEGAKLKKLAKQYSNDGTL